MFFSEDMLLFALYIHPSRTHGNIYHSN